jgi:hypothetical protein
MRSIMFFIVGSVFIFSATYAQTDSAVKDYLGVSSPIHFDNKLYELAWSSNPQDNFYLEEYIVHGDSLDKFKSMILLDVLADTTDINTVVAEKIAELDKIKETNPVVQYKTYNKNGEYMIDFLLSQNTADGKYIDLVERNVYHYKATTDRSGKRIVVLFGISTRSYGDDVEAFFTYLKTHRFDMINKVGAFAIPDITIQN